VHSAKQIALHNFLVYPECPFAVGGQSSGADLGRSRFLRLPALAGSEQAVALVCFPRVEGCLLFVGGLLLWPAALLSNILRTNGRIASIRRLQFATAGFPNKMISSLLPQTKSGGIPPYARSGVITREVRIAIGMFDTLAELKGRGGSKRTEIRGQ
jgi:hypothetical protein